MVYRVVYPVWAFGVCMQVDLSIGRLMTSRRRNCDHGSSGSGDCSKVGTDGMYSECGCECGCIVMRRVLVWGSMIRPSAKTLGLRVSLMISRLMSNQCDVGDPSFK